MNSEIRTQEESATALGYWCEQYCNLKYTHEIQALNLKQSFKYEQDELIQELKEAYISKQLLEYYRSQYDKKLKLNGIEPYQTSQSVEELPEILFDSIIAGFNENNSNSKQFYIDTYLEAKEIILEYYRSYFSLKAAIQKLKETQTIELNILVDDIKYDGIPFYMVTSMYSSIKNNLRTKDKSPNEYDFFNNVYNSVKDKILNNMEDIRKEVLIDYTANINIDICRPEALERIQYIRTQVNLENYTVLKNEWLYSENRYFIIDIKEKVNKIKRTLDYYINKRTSIELLTDKEITDLMNSSGIRLRKNHKYNIINF